MDIRNFITNPTVIEETSRGDRAFDLFSRLLKDRIIVLGTEINNIVATSIQSQLLYLQSQDAEKDISFYINSPGGSVTAGLAIYDTMQFVKCDIATYCSGIAASMGALLLAAGTNGKRHCLENARVMIHQPLGGATGQATDIQIMADEILYNRANLNRILAEHTGKTLDEVGVDSDRDNFMSAAEAKEYGIVDHVVLPAHRAKKS